MKHTSGTAVLIGAVMGGVLGWSGQWLLVSLGNPAIVPPYTWGTVLGLLGPILLALAWPIRSQVRATTPKPPLDPFYATRVVLLSKAGALSGAALTGLGAGLLVFFLTRPVVSGGFLWSAVLAMGGAVVLLIAALIAERWCTLPPDSPEGETSVVPEGDVS